MDRQKYLWNPLMDYWFRMEIEGWEKLPEPPALLIGIHSGAPFVWDAWTVGFQWWRHFGAERRLHGTAHDALMAAPGIGSYFRKMGVLPAAPDSIAGALAAGRDVALWPGGEIDSLRPWTDRDKAVLAGRTGFIRMAIQARRADRPDRDRRRPGLDAACCPRASGLATRAAARQDRAAEDVPDRDAGAVGHEPGDAARDPAADEDPHRVPGPGRFDVDPERARATTTTSTASTARSAAASRAAWTRWRAAAPSRSSAEARREARAVPRLV